MYEPWELVAMGLPMAVAALVEWRQWNLGSWRRPMEFLALTAVIGLLAARIGLIPTVTITLFVLCGIRLSLPREVPQRRQILLMGFLVWITTAISTFEIHFLLWSVLWALGAGAALMQQAWEPSASLRRGPIQAPPFLKVPLWVLSSSLLSAFFFLSLPRITTGLHSFPWGVAGLTSSQAGMSDALDLGQSGPIAPSGEVVVRILPRANLNPEEWTYYQHALSLLRGVVLESIDGQRWESSPETPDRAYGRVTPSILDRYSTVQGFLVLDYFVAPSAQGILPLPYGRLGLIPPAGMPIRAGRGGDLRWMFPSRRPVAMNVIADPSNLLPEGPPSPSRHQLLTQTGTNTEAVNRWARDVVPGNVSAAELARRLTEALTRFRYTLDNPSGNAGNPLQDFLERSQAGHCEYFASSLALMLRYRGIPARVVNGYRLGPWIEEGGYWLVTQNEAHSWVEFFDESSRIWRVADPTPPAPAASLSSRTLWAAFQRWTDAIRFRWDRYVVRYSDEDQLAGFEWVRERVSGLSFSSPGPRTLRWVAFTLLAALGLWAWVRILRLPGSRTFLDSPSRHVLKELRPLVRIASRACPPAPGETIRHWLLRLSRLAPERREALQALAAEADLVAYRGSDSQSLKRMAKTEAQAWKKPSKA
jgi:transglutaminase-like putative cysteine protease